MKAVTISKYGLFPKLISKDLPQLLPGDHLVQMKYAPINPSDLNFYQGFYGIKKTLPAVAGFEGSGIIVESPDKQLIGKKVSVMASSQNGTYSTHLALKSQNIIVWPDNADLRDISYSIINPITAIGLKSRAHQLGAQHIIISAAGSALGKMLLKLFNRDNIKVSGLIRNPAKAQQLKDIGATDIHPIPLTDQATQSIRKNPKSVFLDCIGGQFAGTVFNALPYGSTMINYGRLSKERLGNVDLSELYFRNKRIEGFWLNTLLDSIDVNQFESIKKELIENYSLFKTNIRQQYPLQNFIQAFKESIKDQSQGKILLKID